MSKALEILLGVVIVVVVGLALIALADGAFLDGISSALGTQISKIASWGS